MQFMFNWPFMTENVQLGLLFTLYQRN